jgi:Inhibitor of apoptosis-promoting Bax1
MAIGVALTGLVAWLTSQILGPALLNSPLMWVFVLAPLALVFFISFRINSLSAGTALTLFFVYAASVGLSLATIFFVYTETSITRVFFISAAAFGALSVWGYTTRRNLTGLGSFLLMGLIGIVIASLVNIFPDRLGYAEDQGDVRSHGRRDCRRPQGRDGCAGALPRLHQPVHDAPAPVRQPALTANRRPPRSVSMNRWTICTVTSAFALSRGFLIRVGRPARRRDPVPRSALTPRHRQPQHTGIPCNRKGGPQ